MCQGHRLNGDSALEALFVSRDNIAFSPALPEGDGFFMLPKGLTGNSLSSMETLSLVSNSELSVKDWYLPLAQFLHCDPL